MYSVNFSIQMVLAGLVLVCATGWFIYLRWNRPQLKQSITIITLMLVVGSLVSSMEFRQGLLPIGLLCCALIVSGTKNIKTTLIGVLMVVVVLNYLQNLELSWHINTTRQDPAIVAIVGFLLVSLRITRLSRRQLREEFNIVEQSQELREQHLIVEYKTQVAANLHDLIGHDLTVIHIRLQKLTRLLESIDRQAAEESRDIQRFARTSVVHLREVVEGFNTVDFSGQLDAIPVLLSHCKIAAHRNIDQSVVNSFPPSTLTALRWVLLEAITNVLKHSGARNCWVTLETVDAGAQLTITDDGVGLFGGPSPQHSGAGLSDMRARAQQIGGTARIEENPAGGTRVTITIPVHSTGCGGR